MNMEIVKLGDKQFQMPSPVTVGRRNNMKLAVRRKFIAWKNENAAEYADLRNRAEKSIAATMNGLVAQTELQIALEMDGSKDRKRVLDLKNLLNRYKNVPGDAEEMAYAMWKDGDDGSYGTQLCRFEALLTPVGHQTPVAKAYDDASDEEVAKIESFINPLPTKTGEGDNSGKNGKHGSGKDSETLSPRGKSSAKRSARAASSPKNGAIATESSTLQTATPV